MKRPVFYISRVSRLLNGLASVCFDTFIDMLRVEACRIEQVMIENGDAGLRISAYETSKI